MKTFAQIQKEKLHGDFEIIAEAIGQTPRTVKSKVLGDRKDRDNIVQAAFTILLEDRAKSKKLIIIKIRRLLDIQNL
ncbi:MAG: hypothetical protein DI539_19540 [Flavobacterium psychrophilum]|jgi:predicted transcriptional regulator|nr:MAG: hypothetical protein DI539_19540 [Flavobacterium psychrophilum]